MKQLRNKALIKWNGIISFLLAILAFSTACDKNDEIKLSPLQVFESMKYYESEIFSDDYLKIYGKWKLINTSGGFDGKGYNADFEYLEIKQYGIYGIIKNDSLLEYGKILPSYSCSSIFLMKDEKSDTYFNDNEKHVTFHGCDSLDLNSPCCDRYNYHFIRVEGDCNISHNLDTTSYGILEGKIGLFQGNCMPGPNANPCKPQPISTTIAITYPLENYSSEYLIDSVISDTNGLFKIKLPEGDYSLFLRDGNKFICDSWTCTTDCFCTYFTIKKDSVTNIAANIDHAAW